MSGADMVENSYYKVKGRVPPVQLAESDTKQYRVK